MILLPHTRHWTPVESEARKALARILELFVNRDPKVGDVSMGDVERAVKQVYDGATVMVRK